MSNSWFMHKIEEGLCAAINWWIEPILMTFQNIALVFVWGVFKN